MPVTYREPTKEDVPALAELGRETFVETFAHLYDPEDLNSFLEQTYSEDAVRADMDDPALSYRLAEAGGKLVGYCKIADGVSLDYDPGGKKVMELKQLYIRASHQGSGTAQMLMQWAIEQAKAIEADEILLSVFSENIRAQRFYKRYGFSHIGDTVFMVGNHQDHEFLYLKNMK